MVNWKELGELERRVVIAALQSMEMGFGQIGQRVVSDRRNITEWCSRRGIASVRQRGAQPNNKSATQSKGGFSINTVQRITRRVLLAIGHCLFTCERCGSKSSRGEYPRHHKDRDRTHNLPHNLEVLCQTCHALEHDSERGRNLKGQFL